VPPAMASSAAARMGVARRARGRMGCITGLLLTKWLAALHRLTKVRCAAASVGFLYGPPRRSDALGQKLFRRLRHRTPSNSPESGFKVAILPATSNPASYQGSSCFAD